MTSKIAFFLLACVLSSNYITFKLTSNLFFEQGYNEGFEIGDCEGFSNGYQIAEVNIFKQRFIKNRDSLNNINISINNILEKINTKELFRKISVCSDCSKQKKCYSNFSKELKKI